MCIELTKLFLLLKNCQKKEIVDSLAVQKTLILITLKLLKNYKITILRMILNPQFQKAILIIPDSKLNSNFHFIPHNYLAQIKHDSQKI